MSSLKELQALIEDKYGVEAASLEPGVSMREKGFDSLSIAEFVFAIEDHFDIVLPDDNPNIDTLGELAELVDRVLADKAAKPVRPAKAA